MPYRHMRKTTHFMGGFLLMNKLIKTTKSRSLEIAQVLIRVMLKSLVKMMAVKKSGEIN